MLRLDRRGADEHAYSIRFTPRKPSSIWSVVNIAKMDKLRALATVPPGCRRTVLHWITNAKKEETRAGRLAQLIHACAAGTRLR